MYRKSKVKKAVISVLCCAAVLGLSAVSAKFVYDKWFNPSTINDATLKENTGKDVETHPSKPTEAVTVSGKETSSAKPETTVSTTQATMQATSVSKSSAYEDISKDIDKGSLSGYQAKYPGLYAEKKEMVPVDKKTVYLTFDDGPSGNTAAVLDQLDKYGVKATFFVVTGGKNDETTKERLLEISKRGHKIAIHTYSHEYKAIYKSVDSFLEDLDKVNKFVFEATGERPDVYRFPGGSKNNFNKAVANDILNEMERRGFVAFDWNSSLQDAEGKSYTQHQLAQNAISTFGDRKRVIVLAHDGGGQKTTPSAIGEIVDYAKSKGYVFSTLDGSCNEMIFFKRK